MPLQSIRSAPCLDLPFILCSAAPLRYISGSGMVRGLEVSRRFAQPRISSSLNGRPEAVELFHSGAASERQPGQRPAAQRGEDRSI